MEARALALSMGASLSDLRVDLAANPSRGLFARPCVPPPPPCRHTSRRNAAWRRGPTGSTWSQPPFGIPRPAGASVSHPEHGSSFRPKMNYRLRTEFVCTVLFHCQKYGGVPRTPPDDPVL